MMQSLVSYYILLKKFSLNVQVNQKEKPEKKTKSPN